ncbi:MAG: DUF551 domain-containing protein [Clostridiales bacterium]|nr:DUF551 domain-containing protein [Clostridiales bacterium]
MTIDRAIEILDPEHREHYDSIETVNEACRMGMEALKTLAYQKSDANWTHVDDGLPDGAQVVLVFMVSGPDLTDIDTATYRDGHFYQLGDYVDYIVTHWAYLPPPPEWSRP